ncbi:winged helix-turn-helix domain-containing protein [Streptomyces sp. NPDC003077]|uniref:ArsR/SmtB family transcription factor n=1 Tax=Streptomyces sp. NPDC003077 TaxID=3154443 RepID=UPI0033B39F58
MALRIHFSADDLTQTRLAQAPDPLWEVLLSLHMLQTHDGSLVFDTWRREVRGKLDASLRPLFALAPPRGYSPDFLTPAAASGGLDLGISALLSTPRTRLRDDLDRLAEDRRRLPWVRRLADGEADAVRDLAAAIRSYHRLALAPYWPRVRAEVGADLALRARTRDAVPSGAFDHLMRTLHPSLEWNAPVLTLRGRHVQGDLHLDGRGLLLLPSFFCWRVPTVLRSPALPPVVVYPIEHSCGELTTEAQARGSAADGLGALLGQTRAVMLEAIAEGSTTSELARLADVAAATASHHVAVLRRAGLVVTRRAGGAVLHTLTPLGADLLGSHSGV